MAVTLKRRREAVSYKEASSDDDEHEDELEDEQLSDAADFERPLRKKRAVPDRISTRARTATGGRSDSARLRGRRQVSYREVSSDDVEPPESEAEAEAEEVRAPPVKRRATSVRPARTESSSRGGRVRSLGAPLKPNNAPPQSAQSRAIVSDGHIPAWSTLPYHILLQIFVYASHPLHDDNMVRTGSIAWLARTARICSAFTKPALTALYRNPPIFAIKQTRPDLVRHLIASPSTAQHDYSVMVKRLEIDATRMSQLTDPHNSAADLASLITSLKTLKEVDIFDPWDKPPYRERSKRMRRWYYPDELFEAIRNSELRLRSWHWNSNYCGQGLLWVQNIHTSTAFQSLREVILTKYHSKTSKDIQEDETTTEELLGAALAALPNLKSLVLETCSVVNERLFALLPTDLVSLSITNCGEFDSEGLRVFLASRGQRLEELTLNHNQCLDLSFLVDLKQSCPRLEALRMDMNLFSTLSVSSDNEPLYDELLQEGEIPSWPSTLRVINLEFLRKWAPIAATGFFQSLIDSAEELPWLREVVITAMVDIDWRGRAEYRRQWAARFQEVFAMKSQAPSPHLVSLRAFREWKANPTQDAEDKSDSFMDGVPEVKEKLQIVDDQSESDSDAPLLTRKRRPTETWDSKRLRSRAKSTNYEDESDVETDSHAESETGNDDKDDIKVQGRCHTVVFKIDNSRPQEQQFDEEDFLDAEVSGDEDWNGNDVVDDAYAW